MSARHKEALAHLTYGLGDAGGFVMLTGEVGTGKTTVSKCLLEQLPGNTQAAFILNPTLSAKELLATVCDELHIEHGAEQTSLKVLTDLILKHLLDNYSQGKNTLLIIDEAQHLQAEVLEQLRLLTNLETHTKKLLQVILIGQPELQELLKRRDLRQLAQRITARYHLLPLNKAEVKLYIEHRLSIAGCQRPLFSKAAFALIHKLSGGVPRLINLLCDRSLLGAFSKEKTQVDNNIVYQSAEETLGLEMSAYSIWQRPWLKKSLAGAAMLIFAWSGFSLAKFQLAEIDQAKMADVKNLAAQREQQLALQLTRIPNALINQSRELDQAFSQLFSHWKVQYSGTAAASSQPCETALSLQLQCYWYQGEFDTLNALGYPAVVQLLDSNNTPYYATYLPSETEQVQLILNQTSHWLSKDYFQQIYLGSAVVLWRSPEEFIDVIDESSSAELVQWLENNLSKQQGRQTRAINRVDALLKNQVGQFQQRSGLVINQHADTETVMVLAKPVSLLAMTATNKEVE
nr:AAA family ATPase [Thalassotalea sp. ND16A]